MGILAILHDVVPALLFSEKDAWPGDRVVAHMEERLSRGRG
jgi:hypothetical protein